MADTRPWDYTPSPTANRFMATMLRLPLAHNLLSKMMLLITFTGRKSGKQYTTPVGYHRDSNRVFILTKRFRKWWYNFRDPAPVTLRLRGKNVTGTATAITDVDTIISALADSIKAVPRSADIYGVKMIDGQPNADDLREIAPKVVLIQVDLN
jgi:deazaflavin-dependent oxidoreductase (nitroreductase family)